MTLVFECGCRFLVWWDGQEHFRLDRCFTHKREGAGIAGLRVRSLAKGLRTERDPIADRMPIHGRS